MQLYRPRSPADRVLPCRTSVPARFWNSSAMCSAIWPAQVPSRSRVMKPPRRPSEQDRKSTRLNSSHDNISYAVFCLKNYNTTTILFRLASSPSPLRSPCPFPSPPTISHLPSPPPLSSFSPCWSSDTLPPTPHPVCSL